MASRPRPRSAWSRARARLSCNGEDHRPGAARARKGAAMTDQERSHLANAESTYCQMTTDGAFVAKLGRNEPCRCGSGKKYKNCHLISDQDRERAKHRAKQMRPRAAPRHVIEMMRRHELQEEVRRVQQGLGRPIISTMFKDHRMVAVGDQMFWSKDWKTFPDFLTTYVKKTLGSDWGNAEIEKTLAERHPIMQWYDAYAHYQQSTIREKGQVASARINGIVACYLGLAYSLYL